MAIKGSLREAGLADVCQLLAMGQKTGCLSVTDRSRFGQVFFDRGRITYASLVNRRDRLGDVLLRNGDVSADELEAAVRAQDEEPDRRLGQLLVEQGAIDADTLRSAIEHQIEEAIYYLFTWKRGSFQFEAGKTPEPGDILIAVNPESLLLEGARRVDEWGVIEKKVPSMDLIFGLDRDRMADADVELTREQAALVEAIDGERTVEELAEASGLGEFAVGKALYGLIQAGFAHRVGRRAADEGAQSGDVEESRNLGVAFYETNMFEDADREFRRVLDADPHDATARHYLALIALRQGDAAEAVRRLTALLESTGPHLGALLNLAHALRHQHRYGDALKVLQQAGSLAPDDVRIRLAEGATRLFAGEVEAARRVLDAYRAALEPETLPPAPYYYCAGLAAAVDGRLEDAEALIEEGLGAHPASAPLHNLAGNVAERRSDLAAAEAAYQRAAEEDTALAQAHRNLGDLAYQRGVETEALEHYRRAARLDPDLGDQLYTRLADLHYRRNEREQAIECWRRAVELNPENETARNHLEVVARATG
ncbi:MAG: tetratricopeptide repeat protein [Longimicrobiales bacterium]|nr:tetratricopeptide repeat protein [Longimicrobiales bacterium]